MDISPDQINQMAKPFFNGWTGMVVKELAGGKSLLTLDIKPHHLNLGGRLHGGVTYALADTGMAMALLSALDEYIDFATIEIKMTYLKSVASGTLTCETHLIRRTRSLAFFESDVRNADNVVAKASGSYFVRG